MAIDDSPGLALSRVYFEDLIKPVLLSRFPGMQYAAGRLGTGSDVLGLDDETSRDHDWGLRLTLLAPADHVEDVRRALESEVPRAFAGLPTRFALSGQGSARLQVDATSLSEFLVSRLGFDPRAGVESTTGCR